MGAAARGPRQCAEHARCRIRESRTGPFIWTGLPMLAARARTREDGKKGEQRVPPMGMTDWRLAAGAPWIPCLLPQGRSQANAWPQLIQAAGCTRRVPCADATGAWGMSPPRPGHGAPQQFEEHAGVLPLLPRGGATQRPLACGAAATRHGDRWRRGRRARRAITAGLRMTASGQRQGEFRAPSAAAGAPAIAAATPSPLQCPASCVIAWNANTYSIRFQGPTSATRVAHTPPTHARARSTVIPQQHLHERDT